MEVRKAVIVAAGWGTRFLPLTRSQPKEMLPLIDKPLIQYAVEEALKSGIEQIIIVTAMGKRAIEDYFDRSFELEYFLEKKGQNKLLQQMREISNLADICYIRQKEQLGLGHAVLTTRRVVGNEPFAVILPDDIITGRSPALKQLIKVFNRYQTNILAVERISRENIHKYGVIDPGKVADSVYEVTRLVEKPEPAQAPSDLGIVGRYILMPEIFDTLTRTPPGANGEVQLTDALQLLTKKQSIYAYRFRGTRYDAGTPLGLLKATIALTLKREDTGPEFREYLRKLI